MVERPAKRIIDQDVFDVIVTGSDEKVVQISFNNQVVEAKQLGLEVFNKDQLTYVAHMLRRVPRGTPRPDQMRHFEAYAIEAPSPTSVGIDKNNFTRVFNQINIKLDQLRNAGRV